MYYEHRCDGSFFSVNLPGTQSAQVFDIILGMSEYFWVRLTFESED